MCHFSDLLCYSCLWKKSFFRVTEETGCSNSAKFFQHRHVIKFDFWCNILLKHVKKSIKLMANGQEQLNVQYGFYNVIVSYFTIKLARICAHLARVLLSGVMGALRLPNAVQWSRFSNIPRHVQCFFFNGKWSYLRYKLTWVGYVICMWFVSIKWYRFVINC